MIERMEDFPEPLFPIRRTFLFFLRASILVIDRSFELLSSDAPQERGRIGWFLGWLGSAHKDIGRIAGLVIETEES